jgi:glycosyltransferase involved in cell wall biosynthesis
LSTRFSPSRLRVLYFGTYEQTYPRNAQVISCLRRAGVEVLERHEAVWDGLEQKWDLGAGVLPRLLAAETRLLLRPGARADAVVVGYPGHPDMPAALRAARGRPVVLNPLVSLYDTIVGDRRRVRPGSLGARALKAVERRLVALADLVIADTSAHAELFADLGARRVETVFVGAEERLFTPGWALPARFECLFVGKLAPLHGLETVLAAARLAPELRFLVVGSGQLDALLSGSPPNVECLTWIPYEQLAGVYQRASCALGIFGTGAKAFRVIPNKAFQALACGTPLVTADTPAARELLVDGVSALLVPPGDPSALAGALRRLAADPSLAMRLSGEGLRVYHLHASEEVLGTRWRRLLEQLQ